MANSNNPGLPHNPVLFFISVSLTLRAFYTLLDSNFFKKVAFLPPISAEVPAGNKTYPESQEGSTRVG